ncbi:putative transmembrane protein [Gregarina niphandrodes]|uniref:ER membrane protein complex subunit 3 n=1 Tax=Gregarina niphandrodes TaxID=110365 RepID=A0A023B2M8_GRENI|nr:putative transmembrane protein [Gregarina niphandrodes]EZG55095.1 putative transmembrane protein [Gregarina niphandrodes]|eukprot:XP_011131782.1 putative transmembrane protein [Gregarina niphandrodes]
MPLLQLDDEVFYWALLPVFLITLCSAIIRQALNMLSVLESGASGVPVMLQNFGEVHGSNVVSVSRMTRAAGKALAPASLSQRKAYYIGLDDDGKLFRPPQSSAPEQPAMPKMDPTQMLGGMKYKFISLILDAGLAYLINYLFSECVVAKMPFPLADSFKPILQRGVLVQDLDAGYISALSWYFLILFSSGSYTHILNYITGLSTTGPSILETMNPMMAMGAANPMPMGQFDSAKQFQQEADHWKLLGSQDIFLENVEQIALSALHGRS